MTVTRRVIISVVAFGLVAAACRGGEPSQAPTPSASPQAAPSPTATPLEPEALPVVLPVSSIRFGVLEDVPLLRDRPRYAGPATPGSMKTVAVSPSLRQEVRWSAVEGKLARLGFAVLPDQSRQFFHVYAQADYSEYPIFVTTDVAYHTWHLVFDKVLRDMEQGALLPRLEELVSGLLVRARRQVAELKGTRLAADARLAVQYFQVAGALIGLDVGRLGPAAKRELELVRAHAAMEESPITGSRIDYSLFVPRGHYTRTKALRRYFLGMSVLGQTAFCVPVTTQVTGIPSCNSERPARIALLATRPLVGSGRFLRLWRSIYEPTAFLVGTSDDYTPLDVADAVEAAVPGGFEDPGAFADDAVVGDVVEELLAARPVRIDPEQASIRFMGSRFVIDSYLLDLMVYPSVGTPEQPRLIPSPLDLVAGFGSKLAYRVQEKAGETRFANYDQQLASIRKVLARRSLRDWSATIYDAWLWAMEPMWARHGKAFPDFMRTPQWAAKDLQSGLGSYAELRHDTILYAKQFTAEGGGSPVVVPPRHWVEPDPPAFGRLAAVTSLTLDGLERRGLLTAEWEQLLVDVRDLMAFFERIATDELAGKPISKADNDRLRLIGHTFEELYLRTAEGAEQPDFVEEPEAIIADIGRGGDEVVEIGTGWIDTILVLVPDDEGRFQVAKGGVYSYYEFTWPMSDRLTDERWWQMLEGEEAPARPSWEKVFLAR